MSRITVQKRNLAGEITWQYDGTLLQREPHRIVLEALFNAGDTSVLDVVLREGDRFVETYYDSRWYNVLEIHAREDGHLKGWYCNVSRPAVLAETTVSWVDLALDLWIWPDGRQAVLDQDEFEELCPDEHDRRHALKALAELQAAFKKERPPT